jgi:hypothetical protein
MSRFGLIATLIAVFLLTPAVAAQHPPRKAEHATLAVVYYWKAKPGKMAEYSKYIREVAEPVDADAQRRGAFLTVTTYMSSKPDSPWTHMRVFEVRDQAQADALGKALDEATARAYPSAEQRDRNKQYGATLRDPAGNEVVEILH